MVFVRMKRLERVGMVVSGGSREEAMKQSRRASRKKPSQEREQQAEACVRGRKFETANEFDGTDCYEAPID